MNILLIHPKRARDYSVPVLPIGNILHTTVDEIRENMVHLAGYRFDIIVLPDRSGIVEPQLSILKTRLVRGGAMVVL